MNKAINSRKDDERNTKLSYKERLNSAERIRYEEKLKLLNGTDPYELKAKDLSQDVNLLPAIEHRDIINYLVFTPSPYTQEDLKCWKGLDAYNQFVCGWVSGVSSAVFENNVLVKARVMHSQRMREKSLSPWIIATKKGVVLGSHCDCMAGIGETCTHVAALLFFVDATVRVRDARTVTQDPAWWLIPKSLKGVDYSDTKGINFSSAKSMKRKFDALVDSPAPQAQLKSQKRVIPAPTDDEMKHFLDSLHNIGRKTALLSVVKDYSDKFVPHSESMKLPLKLGSIRDKSADAMTKPELIHVCSKIEMNISEEEARNVEALTKKQSKSKHWFDYRAGRITASKMKAACSTDPEKPSHSLLKKICYPMDNIFENDATKWGIEKEQQAKSELLSYYSQTHENANLVDCGLLISLDYPFIAASPDGMLTCDCCGTSLVEVKCPYSRRGEMIDENIPYLKKCEDGELRLHQEHEYYFQVQTQLGVTKTEFCYFVVWTGADVHVEQIMFDNALWETMCKKAERLFKSAIMPELVGKFFTRLPGSVLEKKNLIPCEIGATATPITYHGTSSQGNPVPSTSSSEIPDNILSQQNNQSNRNELSNDVEERWCYCDQVEYGDMICCDNENCDIQWFHFDCLRITRLPKSKLWFCPDCRKLPK